MTRHYAIKTDGVGSVLVKSKFKWSVFLASTVFQPTGMLVLCPRRLYLQSKLLTFFNYLAEIETSNKSKIFIYLTTLDSLACR